MLESLFNKVAGLKAFNFIKKDSKTGVILANFLRTRFEENLRTAAFVISCNANPNSMEILV